MSSFSSEYIQDTATEEILERFGSDPKLFYKSGEMFVREMGEEEGSHAHFPRQTCMVPEGSRGELLHRVEPCEVGNLTFWCYSEEEGEMGEAIQIRTFQLQYHLSDDTISLHEPHIENSGMMQGRVLRHQRVPSGNRVGGPFLHWRDMNVGVEVEMFGRKYRITRCDQFTRNFLEEHGIKLNAEEDIPEDPWRTKRREKRRRERDERDTEGLSVERDFQPRPALLSFRCCWLDSSNDFVGYRLKRIFRMVVFTVDHTVSLTEETPQLEGQLFLRRVRLPMPESPDGVRRFYRTSDFHPGVWVTVFSRPMFIYECVGEETKQYMTQQYGEVEYGNCSTEVLYNGPPPMTFETIPKKLIFFAKMIDPPSMLCGIDFLLEFDVNSRTVDVFESGQRRRWSRGRSMLNDVDASTFSESHFACGRVIRLFKWRFHLVEADPTTSEYLRWRGRQ